MEKNQKDIFSNLLRCKTDSFKDVDWVLKKENKNQIIFYEINNKSQVGKFIRRVENSSFELLIVYSKVKFLVDNSKVHIIFSKPKFMQLQRFFLDKIYPYPEELRVIGITGTNGKTTCVDIMRQMFNQLQIKAFSIGTLGVVDYKGEKALSLIHTTPLYIDLRKIFYKMFKSHEVCLMEVSSHGINEMRIWDIPFVGGGWTNIGRDHLDYHNNALNYFLSKKSFLKNKFQRKLRNFFIPKEEKKLRSRLSSYPIGSSVPLRKKSQESLNLPLQFRFNVKNVELAQNILFYYLNTYPHKYEKGLNFSKLKLPAGRVTLYENNQKKIIVDFSHTPDGMLKLLLEIKRLIRGRLLLVFGCGGDRDRGKRKIMGNIASKYADFIFITNDNPRYEDEKQIVSDICKGINERKKIKIEYDRKKAIDIAWNETNPHDCLVIMGKGHEQFQLVEDKKIPYSDIDYIKGKLNLSDKI